VAGLPVELLGACWEVPPPAVELTVSSLSGQCISRGSAAPA
jgi:hypothetical protein